MPILHQATRQRNPEVPNAIFSFFCVHSFCASKIVHHIIRILLYLSLLRTFERTSWPHKFSSFFVSPSFMPSGIKAYGSNQERIEECLYFIHPVEYLSTFCLYLKYLIKSGVINFMDYSQLVVGFVKHIFHILINLSFFVFICSSLLCVFVSRQYPTLLQYLSFILCLFNSDQ